MMTRKYPNPVYTRDNFLLSNWCPAVIDGIRYPTLWHAYYCHLTGEAETRHTLYQGVSITTAANYTEMLCPYICPRRRYLTMQSLLMAKYASSPYREQLLKTGNAVIINNEIIHDPFWGSYDVTGNEIMSQMLMDVRLDISPFKGRVLRLPIQKAQGELYGTKKQPY